MYAKLYRGLRLTYSEVESWMSITNTKLSPHEVEAIMTLDEINQST